MNETGPQPGRRGTFNESEALRQDLENTREELGQSVSELTDKLDVPARTKDKVHETGEAVQQKAAEAKQKATTSAEQLKAVAEEKAERLKAKAGDTAGRVKVKADDTADQTKARARQLADKAEAAAPEPVVRQSKRATELVRDNPVSVAAAAVVAALVVWRVLRRRS